MANPKSKQSIRREVDAKFDYPGHAVPKDPDKGRQPSDPNQNYYVWAGAEKGLAHTTWEAIPDPAPSAEDWRIHMWMWARRVRRDILLLEAYLEDQKTVGKLSGDTPFYGDPGDPPPPPEGDFA